MLDRKTGGASITVRLKVGGLKPVSQAQGIPKFFRGESSAIKEAWHGGKPNACLLGSGQPTLSLYRKSKDDYIGVFAMPNFSKLGRFRVAAGRVGSNEPL